MAEEILGKSFGRCRRAAADGLAVSLAWPTAVVAEHADVIRLDNCQPQRYRRLGRAGADGIRQKDAAGPGKEDHPNRDALLSRLAQPAPGVFADADPERDANRNPDPLGQSERHTDANAGPDTGIRTKAG